MNKWEEREEGRQARNKTIVKGAMSVTTGVPTLSSFFLIHCSSDYMPMVLINRSEWVSE